MQISFDIPDAQVPRVTEWIRSLMHEPGSVDPETGDPIPEPTNAELLAEFKGKVRNWIKGQVQQYELLKEHETIYSAYTPLDVDDA